MINRCFLLLILLYRVFFSSFFGGRCRFYPSCSHYANEALHRYPWPRACVLMLKRFVRCHPFGYWGFDHLPGKEL